MVKTAIYARESTDKQDITTLIDICMKKAKELGFNEVKVYKDIESGYSNDRADYLKMLEDIKLGKISTLILYESSRATRDEIEHHLFYKLLAQNKVKLYILNRGWVDPANEDDMFVSGLLNLLDAREGRKTAKRVKDRMTELANKGHWTGGPAPLGYKLVEKKLVIDEEKALIVKEIFNMFIAGRTRGEIATIFGFDNKRVIRMLKNPVYIGKLKYHQQVKTENGFRERKEYEIKEGIHEAIIDDSTFETVQKMLKKVTRQHKRKDYFIFRNILKCHCGGKMYPHEHTDKRNKKIMYRCTEKSCDQTDITQEDLLEVVLEELEKTIDTLDLSTDAAERDDVENKIKFYKRELQKTEAQEKRLVKKFVQDMISESIYDELKTEIDTKLSNFKMEIKKLERIKSSKKVRIENSKILKQYIKRIKQEHDREAVAKLFRLLINEIEFINNFRCIITLNI